MDALEFVSRVFDAAGLFVDVADVLPESEVEELRNLQVRIGMQPGYPLTAIPVNFVASEDLATDTFEDIEGGEEAGVLWIAVDQPSSHSRVNPYAPKGLWERY